MVPLTYYSVIYYDLDSHAFNTTDQPLQMIMPVCPLIAVSSINQSGSSAYFRSYPLIKKNCISYYLFLFFRTSYQ